MYGGKVFLKRMGFRRRVATTAKVEIPDSARKEAGLQYHYRITTIVEKYKIPPSLVLNSDQTPSKYVQVGRFTMAPQGAKKVGIAGSADKRMITLTLTVTQDGKILPFQIIYKGKTKQSFPKVSFPQGFSLSANEKHHSNTDEVLKHLKEIVIPYAKGEREKLDDPEQTALLIWDVFRGQKTDLVTSLLVDNNIKYEYVPNNMTADFQILDLTVNKWLKNLTTEKFNNWFATNLQQELDSGKALDDIDIKFKLSTMKPLHAGWMIDSYNRLSSLDGKQIILAGWRASGITDALEKGLKEFSYNVLDPYDDIDHFDQGEIRFPITSVVSAASEEYIENERVIVSDDQDDVNFSEYNPNIAITEIESDEEEEDEGSKV